MSAMKKPLTFDMNRSPVAAAGPDETPAAPIMKPAAVAEDRKQVGARITGTTYRRLKARAAIQGEKVQDLVEQAITEFLEKQAD